LTCLRLVFHNVHNFVDTRKLSVQVVNATVTRTALYTFTTRLHAPGKDGK